MGGRSYGGGHVGYDTIGVTAPALTAGWVVDVSRESGETYYRNTVTDHAQLAVPDAPAWSAWPWRARG